MVRNNKITREILISFFFIAIVITIFFWKVIFCGFLFFPSDTVKLNLPWGVPENQVIEKEIRNPDISDIVAVHYPWKYYVSNSIKKGVLPFWNSLAGCGYPLIATGEVAIFYPLNILFYFFPVQYGFGIFAITHIFLGMFFFYLLARSFRISLAGSLIGSIIFMFNGSMAKWFFSPNDIGTIIWLPLIILFYKLSIEKKSRVYLALNCLTLGLNIFAGEIRHTLHILLFMFLFAIFEGYMISKKDRVALKVLFKDSLYYFLTPVIFAFLIGSFQILSSFELVSHSQRYFAALNQFYPLHIFPLKVILSTFIPNLTGLFNLSAYSFPDLPLLNIEWYIGIITVALVINSLKKNYYSTFLFVCILIIFMFSQGGILDKLFSSSKMFKTLAFYKHISILFGFCVALLAGIGLDSLVEKLKKSFTKGVIIRLCLPIASLCLMGIFLFLATKTGTFSEFCLKFKLHGVLYGIFLLCILSIIIIPFRLKHKINLIVLLITFFVFFDFFILDYKYNPFSENVNPYPGTPETNFLSTIKEDGRIIRFDSKPIGRYSRIIPPLMPLIYKVYDAQIYENFLLDSYGKFMDSVEEGSYSVLMWDSRIREIRDKEKLKSKLLDLINVKYILTTELLNLEKFELLFEGKIRVYRNKNVLPRAFVVHKLVSKEDDSAVLDFMKSEDFTPSKHIVIEGMPFESKINQSDSPYEDVKMVRYEGNRILVQVDLEKNGFLFISENYFPGWQVLVDGVPSEIIKANYTFQSVGLAKGEHSIEFIYVPRFIKIGLTLGIIGLFGLLILLIHHKNCKPTCL